MVDYEFQMQCSARQGTDKQFWRCVSGPTRQARQVKEGSNFSEASHHCIETHAVRASHSALETHYLRASHQKLEAHLSQASQALGETQVRPA